MKPLGCHKTHSTHVGAYEDSKMGKARERRTVLDAMKDELRQDEMRTAVAAALNAAAKQDVALAAAETAVVKAAMVWWYTSERVVSTTDDLYPILAACAALAKLED